MGSNRVADCFPINEEGEVSPSLSYHELCDRLCPDYMAMGMTYDEYWYGDPWMTKAFRKAHELKRRENNFNLWLQGMYVYEAILNIAPVLRPFSKETKPIPYPSEPYAFSKDEQKEKEQRKQEELDKKNQATIKAWAERVNRLKAEKEAKKGVPSNG